MEQFRAPIVVDIGQHHPQEDRAFKSHHIDKLLYLSTNRYTMPSPVVAIAIVSVVFFVLRYVLNQTDTPKIKNLPEIPGVPIFGNLLSLGNNHAVVARKWAKQYGPVFQTRLGNRVGSLMCAYSPVSDIDLSPRELCSQTASSRFEHSGSRTNRLSSLAQSCTHSTQLSRARRDTQSELHHGMNPARPAARQRPLR